MTVQQQDHQLEIGTATIREHGSDIALPATLFIYGDDTNLPKGTSGLIPHKPLAAQTTYRVAFRDVAGDPVAAWTFTTGAAECDPTAQDCGRGQACYVLDGAPVCTWSGSLSKSEQCTHLNECGPGLTCFRGRCEPYCDASASADPDISCEEQCGQGGYDLPGMEQSDVKVCLAQNCLLESVGCAEGEACYRFGDLYLCDKAGSVAAGGTCQYPNDCVQHTSCMGIDGVFSCKQLCDGPGMPSCGEVCERGERTIFTSPLVRYAANVSALLSSEAQPCARRLGYCAVWIAAALSFNTGHCGGAYHAFLSATSIGLARFSLASLGDCAGRAPFGEPRLKMATLPCV